MMRSGLKLVRNAAGKDVFLSGCNLSQNMRSLSGSIGLVDSMRIGPPVLRVVGSGEFDAYRKRMVEQGRSDGQFKVLRLTSDASFAREFSSVCDYAVDS